MASYLLTLMGVTCCIAISVCCVTRPGLFDDAVVHMLQVGFSTSLGLLQRNGADIDKFMDILRGSALYAPTFDKKLQRMLDRDYANPNFPTKVTSASIQGCFIPLANKSPAILSLLNSSCPYEVLFWYMGHQQRVSV